MSKENDRAKYGRISSVLFKEKDVYVNVVTGPNKEPREMKFSTPRPGVWYVPKEGDTVEIHNIGGKLVARYPYDSPESFSLPTDIGQGDVCFRLNKDTQLYFSVQEDGTVNVDLSADGEVVVKAPTVKLGGDTKTKVVARKGDTVETSDPLTGTNTGTITSGAANTEAQ